MKSLLLATFFSLGSFVCKATGEPTGLAAIAEQVSHGPLSEANEKYVRDIFKKCGVQDNFIIRRPLEILTENGWQAVGTFPFTDYLFVDEDLLDSLPEDQKKRIVGCYAIMIKKNYRLKQSLIEAGLGCVSAVLAFEVYKSESLWKNDTLIKKLFKGAAAVGVFTLSSNVFKKYISDPLHTYWLNKADNQAQHILQ